MTDKLPTIDIKGKQYVMVKDRILAFNELYPNGCIQTEIISPLEADFIVIKAIITPDVQNIARQFVDYSQAIKGQGMINTTSALENASTSAVGRALAYMGIGVIESIASADEVVKATTTNIQQPELLDDEPDTKFCSVHGEDMTKAFSAKKNKYYFSHRNDEGQICFGTEFK